MAEPVDECELNGLTDAQAESLLPDHLRAIREIARQSAAHGDDRRLTDTLALTSAIAQAWGIHL
ncbi:MAG TPA: hypothetical protein VM223_27120 [Planctomycetota bacterium]|nr:hypothetical protein [Planctomycetota bacterium]